MSRPADERGGPSGQSGGGEGSRPRHGDIDEFSARSHPHNGQASSRASAASAQVRAQARARALELKRAEALEKQQKFLSDLLSSLKVLVCAYIATLYYVECALTPVFLHLFSHLRNVDPDFLPPYWVLEESRGKPWRMMLVPKLISMLFHLIWPPPAGNEALRGYLHGVYLIDFVGQKAPVSRYLPLAIDLVIIALDYVAFSVCLELNYQPMPGARAAPIQGQRPGAPGGGEPRDGGSAIVGAGSGESETWTQTGPTEDGTWPSRRTALIELLNSGTDIAFVLSPFRVFDRGHWRESELGSFLSILQAVLQAVGYYSQVVLMATRRVWGGRRQQAEQYP